MVGIGRKYRELKEMRIPCSEPLHPVAQALLMAKSELKLKGEDSILGGGRNSNYGLEFIEILKDEQQTIVQYAPRLSGGHRHDEAPNL